MNINAHRFFVIPISECRKRACLLRVDEPKNNQSSKARWARDYAR